MKLSLFVTLSLVFLSAFALSDDDDASSSLGSDIEGERASFGQVAVSTRAGLLTPTEAMKLLDREIASGEYPDDKVPYFPEEAIKQAYEDETIDSDEAKNLVDEQEKQGFPDTDELAIAKDELEHETLTEKTLEENVKSGVLTQEQAENIQEEGRERLLNAIDDNEDFEAADVQAAIKLGAISEERVGQEVAKVRLDDELGDEELKQSTVETAFEAGAISEPVAVALGTVAEQETGELASIRKQLEAGDLTKASLLDAVRSGKLSSETAAKMEMAIEAAKKLPNSPAFPFSERELLDEVRVGAISAEKAAAVFNEEKVDDKLPWPKQRFTEGQLREMAMRKEITPDQAEQIHELEH